uniref:hormogonium polysaccharide biosynthesis protein HpsA n=1 Tax=Trichocoleus desertorum TaxID=1481672 RepID=UPI0025B4E5DA|nr:hormogonium polysaccharide biosynthesis protein HpsA [Trichocoleus desertorum]
MPTRKLAATHKKLTDWLLRSLLVVGQRSRLTNSGFVLPTVVMVSLVVVLLTTALIVRSLDRTKNASNARVNQAALNAAAPALDRARAKLDALFEDPNLPRATPADRRLRDVMDDSKYTFPDEVRLKLVADANNNNTIGENSNRTLGTYTLENDETSRQGWKFPVDTDSNGRYDAYTFYSIAWRLPPRSPSNPNTFTRPRSPLEARTPPMSVNNIGGQCATAAGTSASLVGNSGWYASNGKIVKSFSVYAATVPIAAGDPVLTNNLYEANNKNKGISVLEVQQDRSRVPLNNNAVLYEDDLEITPGPQFKLNGRVFTNSNLFTTGANVTLFQVSSQNSCYYTEDNSRIEVGGNVGKGSLTGNTVASGNVGIHLFNGIGAEPREDVFRNTDQSTTNNPREVAYNSKAYTLRIDFLVRAAQLRAATTDPQEVIDDTVRRLREDSGLGVEARRRSLERYFRNRTRRIPYAEVPFGQEATLAVGNVYTTANVFAGRDTPLRPPDEWALPANLNTGASFNNLTLATARPEATDSETNRTDRIEARLGDRMLIGNGLPAVWFNGLSLRFVGRGFEQLVRRPGGTPEKWTARNTIDRTRSTRVDELSDLGDTGRNGFWEQSAAQRPEDKLQAVGGLRVVTGAGIYSLDNTFLPSPPDSDPVNPVGNATLATYDDPNTPGKEAYRVVWPDSMPMSRADDPTTTLVNESTLSGNLKMRATAVYHYDISSYNPDAPGNYQAPVACVSSYYDATNSVTARNPVGFPDVSGGIDTTVAADGVIDRLYNGDLPPAQPAVGVGKSNNGVSYAPGVTSAGVAAGIGPNAEGLFLPEESNVAVAGNLRAKLNYQANVVFPDGRFANQPLRNALTNLNAGRRLSLADQSAIDSSLCGLEIASNTLVPSEARIPHGAIKEAAFLDARQVKAIEGRSFAITTGSSVGNVRTYTVSNLSDVGDTGTLTPRIRLGDVVTIQGFAGGGNQTSLNVVKGTVTAVTPDATPTNPSGTIQVTALAPATVAATTSSRAGITELLTTRSDRAIEDRQPLEVRTTVIDLNRIRRQPITGGVVSAALGMQGEYVLPNSGIIYATRDDATPDLSEPLPTTAGLTDEQRQATQQLLSPVDYRLDPSRRPSGIMLVNGSRLNRTDDNTYRAEEKGLILATNLPVYVQADTLRGTADALKGFNLHNSEEFTQTLATIANWGVADFYNARTTLDPQFACRPGTPGLNCGTGDFWRPASVISDAVSLLSDNFALGYRADGDYDLRNNAQDSWATVKKRRQNGFFDNNFVTSRAFTDADYRGNPDTPPATYRPSSYFNNFITPIQRRVNTHEYLMEMCVKIPVSSCGPTDWWVRPPRTTGVADLGLKATAAIGVPLNIGTTHTAGTTSQPAAPGFQQYARRVAFARNVYGALEFTPMISGAKSEATAIPIGINDTGAIDRFPYTGAPPRRRDNTLWYATVKNVNTPANAGYGQPGYAPNRTYAIDQPLYYLPPDKGGEKLILPDTPEIPGVPSLNGPGNEDPSDFTACVTNAGQSQKYQVTGLSGTCNTPNLDTRIEATRDGLANLGPSLGTLTGDTQTLTASGDVNVYTLKNSGVSINNGATITLRGNADSIFVFQGGSSVEFGSGGPGVTLVLDGVSPNNVFWISNGAIKFADATVPPHQLAGNFLGKTNMFVGANTNIFGGRLLGFTQNSTGIPVTSSITAVTADGQPLLAPVLQTQVTTGSPTDTNDLSSIASNNVVSSNTRWQQRATTNNFNLVIAAGDSPARVANTADTANSWIESGGGLHNFPRFLENWTGVKARIAGSFIQIKRSAYATAPFQPVVVATDGSFVQSTDPRTATGVSLFGSDYRQAYRTDNGEIGTSTNWGKHPYYEPPTREWGFDVALLTQLPDLFAQRFTAPSGTRDEFYRQVDRNDAWVQTLLCSAQAQNLANAQARQSGVAPAGTSFVPALQPNNPYRPACNATNADYNRL